LFHDAKIQYIWLHNILCSHILIYYITFTIIWFNQHERANNTKTKSSINKTTNLTSGASGHVFTFHQDRYGSESTWNITDANGTVVASGGPYTDLAANWTQARVTNVTFTATGCYTLTVNDSYGDGINAGYGAGSYKLTNAANLDVVTSNGIFGKQDVKLFQITSLTGFTENADL